jgi:hypothetical protein
MWDEQARALSGSFRVMRYDQRGHGKTEAPEGRYPFAILLADAIALMDALEIRHISNIERPEAFTCAVEKFLKRHGAGSGQGGIS